MGDGNEVRFWYNPGWLEVLACYNKRVNGMDLHELTPAGAIAVAKREWNNACDDLNYPEFKM